MPELVVFADAEDLMRRAANSHLPGVWGHPVTAYVTRPNPLPSRFVLFTRTGGVPRDLVTDVPTIAVDVYAQQGGQPDDTTAVDLARYTAAWINALDRTGHAEGVSVYECAQLSGPYLNPDPLAPNHARFSCLFQIALRGQTLNT